MNYKVVFAARVIKDLRSIPKEYQKKILSKTENLSKNPYPHGAIKLKGIKEEF